MKLLDFDKFFIVIVQNLFAVRNLLMEKTSFIHSAHLLV